MVDLSEKTLRAYVIGVLPEPEQTALEEVLLNDRAKFEEAWEIENELVDRYVRNLMPAKERAQFERHYLVSPKHRERVATADALLREIDETPLRAASSRFWWQRWRESWQMPQLVFSGALAAALLLTLAGAWWLWRERSQLNQQLAQARQQAETEAERRAKEQQQLTGALKQEQERSGSLQTELEKLRQQKAPVAAPALLSFLLSSASRADGNAPVTISGKLRNAQLLMEPGPPRYGRYQATLQTVEGRALFSIPARLTNDRVFIAATLPLARAGRGDYVLVLSGQKANGEVEEISRYFFRIQ